MERARPEEAAAVFRNAAALKPAFAEAHCNLGWALWAQGLFAESLVAYQRGDQLGRQQQNWRYPSDQWVKNAQRLAELERRLPAILKGQRQPASAAEEAEFAEVCRLKQLYRVAADRFARAMNADPEQVVHRYEAVRCAARAAAGEGKDMGELADAERTRLRNQALDWLRAELAQWTTRLEKGTSRMRLVVRQSMQEWQRDNALAGFRAGGSLGRLPAKEREAWRTLWADVAALLKRTS
jgi:tetratricopeptide (TPR) repeat protein